eukprot:scaffold1619_cov161-Amphora_coffeaeformis.AAC.14
MSRSITAFTLGPRSTTSFGRELSSLVLYDAVALDTVSSPAALAEERMLQGPHQTLLEEASESKRNALWKRLQKEAKARARSSAPSMGFGGAANKGTAPKKMKDSSSSMEHAEYDPDVDKKLRYGAVVMDQGVARVNGVLNKDTAAALLGYINQSLADTQKPRTDLPEEELYKQQTKFSDVLGKLNRWDMLMPLEESKQVMQAMWELLEQTYALSDAIKSILGPAPKLYELGTLISDPGSERQMLHADYNFNPDFTPVVPPALTCFCALQDISPEMGPTTFIPKSATEEYHQEIQMREALEILAEEGILAESPNQLNTLGTGDCSLYNPMLLHCGGANRSNQRRVIFYFSFKNPKFDEKDWPLAYASLSPDLRARALSLPDIHAILKDWKKSKSG